MILKLLSVICQNEMSSIHFILQVRKTTEEKGWILVSDTAWPGYEDIPSDIMAGYGTIFR